MPGLPLRRLLTVLTGVVLAGSLAPAANACPFCSMQGETLTNQVGQASMVLYGTLQNAKLGGGGDLGDGTTDLLIENVVKDHEARKGNKVITLTRYIDVGKDSKYKFLVFCDIFKDKIDPYRGLPVKADSDIGDYLKKALAVKDKPIGERLKFFFNYLDNADVEVSNDAYKEFANADYKDYRDMAKTLPADRIAHWLQDKETATFRYGLYASMLGHCGNDKHAQLLRGLLEDPEKRVSSGVDGILAGYTMLKPKEGWEYIRGILKDPSKEFMFRYAALRSARFFWDQRPDVVARKDISEGVTLLLDQSDIADLAIEDLRKWSCWDTAARIVALYDQKSHDIPIIHRSILRYCLNCPDPKAADLVKRLRAKDPQMVKDAEELLKLESAPAGPTAGLK